MITLQDLSYLGTVYSFEYMEDALDAAEGMTGANIIDTNEGKSYYYDKYGKLERVSSVKYKL